MAVEFWVDIYKTLRNTKDIVSIEILRKLYLNPAYPYVLDILVKEMKTMSISKSSVYRRCHKLEKMGLLKIVNKKPCVVCPQKNISPVSVDTLIRDLTKVLVRV